jgi:DNA-directed RNA polymerase omega subunit
MFAPAPKKLQAQKEPAPYKKVSAGSLIAENIENAVAKFGGNKYDMLIVATTRARDIQRGAMPLLATKSKPVVTALLEIEAGLVDRTYKRITRKL